MILFGFNIIHATEQAKRDSALLALATEARLIASERSRHLRMDADRRQRLNDLAVLALASIGSEIPVVDGTMMQTAAEPQKAAAVSESVAVDQTGGK